MKRALLIAAGFCVSIVGLGVVVHGEISPALKTLIDVDRAFAKMSVDKSTRDAFLEYLADDSLLFRPGPVPGKMFTRNRPAPPGKLSWAPTLADAASSGDIGYTSGPWEFRKGEMTETPSSYGHYVKLWRMQKDGNWRLEVELSISHDKFTTAVADVKDTETPPVPAASAGEKPATATSGKPKASAKTPAAKADAAKPKPAPAAAGAGSASGTPVPERGTPATATTAPGAPGTPGAMPAVPLSPAKQAEEALKDVDRAFAKAVTDQGAVKAWQAIASDQIRLYRNSNLPGIGKAAIEKISVNDLGNSWQPTHARISASGDLAYTTGMITLGAGPSPGSTMQPHYYVRVWRKDTAGAWKVVVDVAN